MAVENTDTTETEVENTESELENQPPVEKTKAEIEDEVKGMSPEEAERTRQALRKANEEAKTRRLELQKYSELGVDPETIAQWKQEREEADIKRLEEERNFGELQDRLKNSYEERLERERQKLTEYEEKVNGYRKSMENILVDNEAMKVLTEMGGDPELVLHKLKQDVKVVENDLGDMKVQVMDANGQPRVKDNGGEFTIKDYLTDLREHPSYGKAFTAPKVSGGGSKTDTGGVGDKAGTPPKVYKSEMSAAEMAAYAGKWGHEALRGMPRKRPNKA